MVILAAQHIDVERRPRRNRERVENMRDHLRREVADLFTLEAQVGDTVRS